MNNFRHSLYNDSDVTQTMSAIQTVTKDLKCIKENQLLATYVLYLTEQLYHRLVLLALGRRSMLS